MDHTLMTWEGEEQCSCNYQRGVRFPVLDGDVVVQIFDSSELNFDMLVNK